MEFAENWYESRHIISKEHAYGLDGYKYIATSISYEVEKILRAPGANPVGMVITLSENEFSLLGSSLEISITTPQFRLVE